LARFYECAKLVITDCEGKIRIHMRDRCGEIGNAFFGRIYQMTTTIPNGHKLSHIAIKFIKWP
jgi:hypothetical protein